MDYQLGFPAENTAPPSISGGAAGLASLLDESRERIDNYFASLPAGFRFKPTDRELIQEYLIKKIKKQELPPNRIHDEDVYKYCPQQLSEMWPLIQGKEEEWYFFTSRDKKYPRGKRPDRSIGTYGYWKPTGALDKIRDSKKIEIIGFKGTLEFYEGRQRNGVKTKWRMHEYELPDARKGAKTNAKLLDEFVLVKLYINRRDRSDSTSTSDDVQDPSTSSVQAQIQLPQTPPPQLGFTGQWQTPVYDEVPVSNTNLPPDFQWQQERDHFQEGFDDIWSEQEREFLFSAFNF